jgi:hypothetical protein
VTAGGSRRKDVLFAEVTARHSGLITRIALSYERTRRCGATCPGHLLAIWLALELIAAIPRCAPSSPRLRRNGPFRT